MPLRVRHPAVLAALGGRSRSRRSRRSSCSRSRAPTTAPPPPADLPGSTHPGAASICSQNAASQYNPFGTSPENPATVGLAIDGNPDTYWQTSTYLDGVLGKSGVGLYVDAKPGVAADRAVRRDRRRPASTCRSGAPTASQP